MDHVWQIAPVSPPEHEMLEAYMTLGFLAGQTQRVELLAMVTARPDAYGFGWKR